MAASTVTRSHWTDDDGSGTVGTIINESELQKIYDEIDLLISGTGAYATLELGGSLKVDGDLTVVGNIFPGTLGLLHEASGTSTAAGATTVDSYAIPAGKLTAKDQLLVAAVFATAVAFTGRVDLWSVTDGAVILPLSSGGNINAPNSISTDSLLTNDQATAAKIIAQCKGFSLGGATVDNIAEYTSSVAWTAAQTIGLRHNGVNVTGTFRYRWWIFKRSGQ